MKLGRDCKNLRTFLALATLGLAASVDLLAGVALAGQDVGVAVSVRNEVTGKIQSQVVKIEGGSNVFGKEVVKTNADSSAKIVLKDSTNLNVGPNSSVSLDNFVFQGDSDYRQAGFNLAKGAFRFTSGGSDKRAYDLKTPSATIGVRGTDFVMIVKDKRSHVEVKEGRTVVCPLKASTKQPAATAESLRKSCRKADSGATADLPTHKSPVLDQSDQSGWDSECCHKGCAEVNVGEAVDVTESCIMSSQFMNANVGEGQMSYAEATAMGANGLPMEALIVGAGMAAAITVGIIESTNNNNESGM